MALKNLFLSLYLEAVTNERAFLTVSPEIKITKKIIVRIVVESYFDSLYIYSPFCKVAIIF